MNGVLLLAFIFKVGPRPACTFWANSAWKISKIGATGRQIIRPKCSKFDLLQAMLVELRALSQTSREGLLLKGGEKGKGRQSIRADEDVGKGCPDFPKWGVWICQWRRGGMGRRVRREA